MHLVISIKHLEPVLTKPDPFGRAPLNRPHRLDRTAERPHAPNDQHGLPARVASLDGETGPRPINLADQLLQVMLAETEPVMHASVQLLERNPSPSRAEIAHELEGNLCRCTGYSHILDAVERAAAKMAAGGNRP